MNGSMLRLTAPKIALLAVFAAVSQNAFADGNGAKTHLSGYQEVPLALSTPGQGTFKTHINRRNQEIRWELSYEDLEGTVTQAHIHFNARSLNGPIVVFLCTNLGNAPPAPASSTQPCPPAPAKISGTITPADVLASAAQGLAAGEFDELVDAIQAGATYANIHTTKYPGGEVRGQIHDH